MRHLRSLPFILALLLHSTSIAGTQSAQQDESMEQPLAPTTCITSLFTKTGTSFWYNITLVLTNKCGANVDFQNVKVTFETADSLNVPFWGSFGPLSYPDSNLQITSQLLASGRYLASFSLHFPEFSWSNSILKNNQSITIYYGASSASYVASSTQIYLGGTQVPQTGTINLANTTPRPTNVVQNYAPVSIVLNSQVIQNVQVPWSGQIAIPNLVAGTYSIQTQDVLDSQGNTFHGTATPSSVSVVANQSANSTITYAQVIKVGKVNIAAPSLPSELSAYLGSPIISMTRQDTGASVTQSIPWNTTTTINGLDENISYAFSGPAIFFNGYRCTASFNPNTAISNALTPPTTQLSYTCAKAAAGRIIAYVPGWKTPPSASSLANAGYTHVLAAFGVFSTTQPGNIVSAFDTVTKAYIDSLHQVGIKVLLSLGGALTSINGTSVDFHQVLSLASSPATFQSTFVNSVNSMMSQYGFDGIDIDIEHGLQGSGTFTNPTGDIAVLAGILNTLHQNNPSMLISLAPQVANISATSGFDGVWGNYASLIMQTYNALSWVGIQIYNTGCAYGIDHVCYADDANSPNLSVAMATALLENWPQKDSTGRATGFQPYISYLTPSQIVLGYPAPNSSGASDGSPVKPTAVIKRAIQCLKTGQTGANACDTYAPPRNYLNLGGVFEWEATYDQDNNFKFATDLKSCVIGGSC